jgi:glutaminyl-peptide cyclotransferase
MTERIAHAAISRSFAAVNVVLLVSLGCVQAQTPAPSAQGFDGARALEHVRQLVAIGPRVAGTPGATQARDYIASQLKVLGLTADEQSFEAATPAGPLKMVNLRVGIPGGDVRSPDPSTGSGQGRLIIAGHYDTKRFRAFAFVGANDAGSSTAFLIEIARVLKNRKNALPIELLFLDGEEAVVEWQGTDHTYGSRYYVEAARVAGTLPQIRALVLVDMIGDRDLRISRESNSTAWLTDIIWGAAKRLKRPEFLDRETAIEDDHLPFLEAGVPAVDIIDLDYPAWHKAEDTLDRVSAGSLQVVGDVLLAALPEIEKRLLKP